MLGPNAVGGMLTRSRCYRLLGCSREMLLVAAVLLLFSCASAAASQVAEQAISKPRSTEAYATLVYGESFVLGARVLGQSLRDTGTHRCVTYVYVYMHMQYVCAASHAPGSQCMQYWALLGRLHSRLPSVDIIICSPCLRRGSAAHGMPAGSHPPRCFQ